MFSVLVYSVAATIEVISTKGRLFRVKCFSKGGTTLRIGINGPGYHGHQMRAEPVRDPKMQGNDEYSATTNMLSGVSNGDTYICTASNGEPELREIVQLKGISL